MRNNLKTVDTKKLMEEVNQMFEKQAELEARFKIISQIKSSLELNSKKQRIQNEKYTQKF